MEKVLWQFHGTSKNVHRITLSLYETGSSAATQFQKRTMKKEILIYSIALGSLAAWIQPIHANQTYRDAKLAFSRRNYSEALVKFKQSYSSNPSNGNPLFYIGYILEYQDQKKEAVEYYQKAVNLRMDSDLREKAFWKIVLYHKFTRNWNALYTYSSRFLQFQHNPEVQKLKDLADAKRDPLIAKVNSLHKQAKEAESNNNAIQAKELYQEILTINEEYEPAHWKLAQFSLNEEDFSTAGYHFQKLIQLDPESWQYRYKYSILLYKIGEWKESLKQLEQSEKYNDKPGKQFRFYSDLARGLIYLEQARYTDAKPLLKKSLKESIPATYGAYARIEAALQEYEEAKTLTEKAFELEPNQKDAKMALLALSIHNKDLSQAKKLHATLFPSREDGGAHFPGGNQGQTLPSQDSWIQLADLAALAVEQEEFSFAKHLFKKIEKSELVLSLPHITRLRYRIAKAKWFVSEENYTQAIGELNSFQRDSEALYELAKIHALAENYDLSRSTLHRAIQLNKQLEVKAQNDPQLSVLFKESNQDPNPDQATNEKQELEPGETSPSAPRAELRTDGEIEPSQE